MRNLNRILAGLLLLGSTAIMASSDAPVSAGGIGEPTTYHRDRLDNVNVSNGAVSIDIPLASFTVDGGFGYSIGLFYNSSVWTFLSDGASCNVGGKQITEDLWHLQSGFSSPNFGPMWRLSLGPRLEADTMRMVDGSTVTFQDDGFIQTISFSTDGSYYRKRDAGSTTFVDAPNGIVYEFDADGRPVSVIDQFGATVLTYTYPVGQTVVSDLAGREITMDWSTHTLSYPASHGQTATISFETDERQIYLRGSGPGLNNYACIEGEEYAQDGSPLTFLTKVIFADSSSFEFDYYTYEQTIAGTSEAGSGAYLKETVLPTGGVYKYHYQSPGSQALANNPISRLSRKFIHDSATDPDPAIWKYTYSSHFASGYTTVSDPLGNETRHYFDTRDIELTEPGWNNYWFRGLPFDANQSIDSLRGHKLYLSSSTYEGTAENGTLLRQRYVRYVADNPDDSPAPGQSAGEKEKRLKGSATLYFDEDSDPDEDYRTEIVNADWDGFGHWRKTETLDAAASEIEFTAWNPHLDPGNAANIEPWILNTYEYMTLTRGPQIKRVDYAFDTTTGFLKCVRNYRNFGETTSNQDLVELRLLDNDSNIGEIILMGADQHPLSGTGCDSSVGEPSYRSQFDYINGSISKQKVLDPDTGDIALIPANDVIDPGSGAITAAEDANGLVTGYSYDLIGRPTGISPPGDLPVTIVNYCLATQTGCATNQTTYQLKKDASVLEESVSNYDGLGRLTDTQNSLAVIDADSTQVLRTLFEHDDLDRKTKVSTTDTAPTLSRATSLEYDRFGRITKLTQPDGSIISTEYSGRRSTTETYSVMTEAGMQSFPRTFSRGDYRGLVTSVSEPSAPNGTQQITSYQYDLNRNLTLVQTGSQQRSFSFDAMGWKTSANHPELGASLFNSQFDVLGNVGRTVIGDRTLETSHDVAGRPIRIHAPGVGPLIEYFRDANRMIMARRHNYIANDPQNQNAGLQHYVVTERYGYAPSTGLLAGLSSSIVRYGPGTEHVDADRWFEHAITINERGMVAAVSYPDARRSGADRAPSQVALLYNGLTPVELRNSSDNRSEAVLNYHRGVRTATHYGNGLTQTRGLDSSGMLRPSAIRVDGSMQTLWETGPYTYDGAGNIHSIGSDVYSYDAVERLVSANVAGIDQTADFDVFGNLTSLSTAGDTSNFAIDGLSNRLSSISGVAVDYDAFGNVTQWGDRFFNYDALDMVTASEIGGQIRQYIYDSGNRRVGTIDPGGIKWTLRNVKGSVLSEYSDQNGDITWNRDYLYVDSRRVAAYGNGSRRYFHADHLGSTRVITDENGVSVARYDYHPFGGLAMSFGSEVDLETFLFTGHERDQHTNEETDDLDYMLARYYSPAVARFLSTDPVLGQVALPQSWNRFAYVQNNPLNATDPTGMCTDGDIAGATPNADTPSCVMQPEEEAEDQRATFWDEILVTGDAAKDLTDEDLKIPNRIDFELLTNPTYLAPIRELIEAESGPQYATIRAARPWDDFGPLPENPNCMTMQSIGPKSDAVLGFATANLDFGCSNMPRNFKKGRAVGKLVGAATAFARKAQTRADAATAKPHVTFPQSNRPQVRDIRHQGAQESAVITYKKE